MNAPPFSIELTARERDSHRKVTIITIETGSNFARGVERFDFSLEIPPEPSFAADRVERYILYLDGTEASRVAQGKADGTVLRQFREQRANVLLALKDACHESRTGVFDIFAQGHSTLTVPGVWNGTTRSDPITIEVVHEGEFFDQPAFR